MQNDLRLAWTLMFGEEMEKIPDPNLPENRPRFNAEKERKKIDWTKLLSGPLKPFFDDERKLARAAMISLYSVPRAELCSCKACVLVREFQLHIEMCMRAESYAKDGE